MGRWRLPPVPPSPSTQLISGCLCHGLEMTGAGSPSPWQATAQITPLPERANALLMNNKSTLITNCQPNQLALQLSQTASLGTAAAQCTLPCLGSSPLFNYPISSSAALLNLSVSLNNFTALMQGAETLHLKNRVQTAIQVISLVLLFRIIAVEILQVVKATGNQYLSSVEKLQTVM